MFRPVAIPSLSEEPRRADDVKPKSTLGVFQSSAISPPKEYLHHDYQNISTQMYFRPTSSPEIQAPSWELIGLLIRGSIIFALSARLEITLSFQPEFLLPLRS